MGVPKFDLPGWWARLRQQFQSPPTSNPKLVHYLAAGSVHGLNATRYERRIARNRFFALLVVLILVLLGLASAIMRGS